MIYQYCFSLCRSWDHQEVLESILSRFPRSGVCPQQCCVRWRDGGVQVWAPPGLTASSAVHSSFPHPRQPPGFTSCPLCIRGMVTFHTKYSSMSSADRLLCDPLLLRVAGLCLYILSEVFGLSDGKRAFWRASCCHAIRAVVYGQSWKITDWGWDRTFWGAPPPYCVPEPGLTM